MAYFTPTRRCKINNTNNGNDVITKEQHEHWINKMDKNHSNFSWIYITCPDDGTHGDKSEENWKAQLVRDEHNNLFWKLRVNKKFKHPIGYAMIPLTVQD